MKGSSGPAPVFGRPIKTRVSFSVPSTNTHHNEIHSNDHQQTEADKISSISKSMTLRSDEKLRLIQLEISEKEACNVLRTICQDAAKMFNMVGNEEEIRDLLSGVLILGNLCKRLGHEKVNLEKKLEDIGNSQNDTVNKYKEKIEQLEQIILRLQAENTKAIDNLTEANIRFNQRMAVANKEMRSIQEKYDECRLENERLNTKLQYQERRVMDIPRIEEKYMRTARKIVREQEVANTMNKIEMKKNNEELKSCQFWKNKATALEEMINKLQSENNELQSEQRKYHLKYTGLLSSYDRLRNSGKGGGKPSIAFATNSAAVQQEGIYNSSNKSNTTSKRPLSAPSTSMRASSSAMNLLPTANTTEDTAALTVTDLETTNNNPNNNNTTSNKKKPAILNRQGSSLIPSKDQESLMKAVNNMNADEIKRLYLENQQKQQKIIALTQQLSYARAYPLRSIGETDNNVVFESDYNERKDENMKKGSANNGNANGNSGNGIDGNMLYAHKIYSLPYMQDELESVSSTFLAEEEQLQEQRIHSAVQLQLAFNERRAGGNSGNGNNGNGKSAHIQAIRASKSFAHILDAEEWENEEMNHTNRSRRR